MVDGRILTAGVMFAIFASFVGVSFAYPVEARFTPLVIGIPGLILSLIQLVSELRTKTARVILSEERGREYRMFGWFAFFILGIILFGFPYAGPVVVAAYLHFSWHEKWYTSLGAAFFSWVVLHYLFGEILGLPLFEGLIVEWLTY